MHLRPACLTGPLLVLLATTCAAPEQHLRSPGPHLPLRRNPSGFPYRGHYETFASGMRALALEIKDAPTTWVTISYTLTGLPDPEGREGLSALAERLSGRGAMVRGGLRAGERLFALGALHHSDSSADEFSFDSRIRPRQLEALLAIEADRLRDPLPGLDDEEIARVRENLAAALESGETADAIEVLEQRTLGGTPYARRRPTAASVRAIQPQEVREHLRRVLRPERAVVAVIGPDKAERALRLVTNAFGQGGPKVVAPVNPPATSLSPPAPELADLPGTRPHRELWLGWSVPGHAGRALVATTLAVEELERALRLRAGKKDLDPLVKWVEGGQVVHEGAGLITMQIALSDSADAARVRAALVETAAALGTSYPEQVAARVERRRWDVTYNVFRQIENGTIAGVAELVRALDQPDAITEWNKQVDEIPFGLPAFLRAHVRPDRAAAVLVAKAPQAEPEAEQVEAPSGSRRMTSLLAMASPGSAEVRALLSEPFPAGAVRRTLPNGLEVVVLPRGAFPTVHVSLFVKADSETPEARARKRAALRAIELESRWRLSSFRSVPGGFEFHEGGPAVWLPYFLANVGCWTWTTPSEGKVREVVKATRSDEAKGRTGGSEGGVYGAVQDAIVSPASTKVAPGTPMARVKADQVVRELPGWFRPDRATLVIVGEVKPDDALWNDVQDAVGTWRVEAPAVAEPPAPAGPERRRFLLFDFPGSERTHATIIARTPPRGQRDEGAHAVLAKHVGELGWQLATPSGTTSTLGGNDGTRLSSIRLGLRGRPAAVVGVIAAALDDLDRLRTVGISPVDLDFVRWGVAREEAFRYDDLPTIAERLGGAALRGVPVEELSLAEPLAATTAASVQAYAKDVMGRELVVISGDAKKLAPVLKAAGFELETITVPRELR